MRKAVRTPTVMALSETSQMPKPQTIRRPISVIDLKVAHVGFLEAIDLAFFLGEGLDHTNAGNGVGEHAGHFGPHPVDLLEAIAQPVAHRVDQPGDEGQRNQGDDGQARVDGDQDGGGHRDHQHVGGEVEQVHRQEQADAVGFGADARHQVAGALAAEIFERQALQVFVGGDAQVGADAFAGQRQDVGFGPAQAPGHEGGGKQAAQKQHHLVGVDGHAVLERDQDLVHQRHGQVGRHQRGGGGRQREQETGQQLTLVGLGEAPQAQQRPGGWRGVDFPRAGGAFVGARRQRGVAGGAGEGFGRRRRAAGEHAFELGVEAVGQVVGGRILGQREAPAGQFCAGIHEVEAGDAGLVAVTQLHAWLEGPRLPFVRVGIPAHQAAVGEGHKAASELQLRVQVEDEAGEKLFAGGEGLVEADTPFVRHGGAEVVGIRGGDGGCGWVGGVLGVHLEGRDKATENGQRRAKLRVKFTDSLQARIPAVGLDQRLVEYFLRR